MWVLKFKVISWPWPKVIYIWKLKLAFLRNDWAILNQILFCAWPKYQVSVSQDHWSSGFMCNWYNSFITLCEKINNNNNNKRNGYWTENANFIITYVLDFGQTEHQNCRIKTVVSSYRGIRDYLLFGKLALFIEKGEHLLFDSINGPYLHKSVIKASQNKSKQWCSYREGS